MKNKFPKWERWLLAGVMLTSISLAAGFIMAIFDISGALPMLVGVAAGIAMIAYAISWCDDDSDQWE